MNFVYMSVLYEYAGLYYKIWIYAIKVLSNNFKENAAEKGL